MSETTEETGAQGEQPPDEGATEAERQAVESRARRMGWVPRNAWSGDRAKQGRWLEAAAFVEQAERKLPLAQERLRAQDEVIRGLRAQINEQSTTLGELVATSRRAEAAGYRRAMQDLEAKRDAAVERGDMAGYKAANAEIKELGQQGANGPAAPPQAAPSPQPQARPPAPDPIVQAWIRRNPWFNTDHLANVAAIKALDMVERERPGDSLDDHLEEVERRIRHKFNNIFDGQPVPQQGNGAANGEAEGEPPAPRQNTRRQAPPMVTASSGSPAPRRVQPRSFEAMPADVKAQFERQKKMMEGKGEPLSKEEFARYYYEQFEEATMPWQESA